MHIDNIIDDLIVGSVTIRGQQYAVRQPTLRQMQFACVRVPELPAESGESKADRSLRWLIHRNAIQIAVALGLDLGDPHGAFDLSKGAQSCGAWGLEAAGAILDRLTDDEADKVVAEMARLDAIDPAEAAAAKS